MGLSWGSFLSSFWLLVFAHAHDLWACLALVALSFYGFIAFGAAFDVTLINGLMQRRQRRWQRW